MLPRAMLKRFNQSNYLFTMFLLLLFGDTRSWAEYLKNMFRWYPFYKQRMLFYSLRRIFFKTFFTLKRNSNILGMYFSLKGKVAISGGQRKKVLRVHTGKFTCAEFNIKYRYKFCQIWAKSGAIGLKTITTYSK